MTDQEFWQRVNRIENRLSASDLLLAEIDRKLEALAEGSPVNPVIEPVTTNVSHVQQALPEPEPEGEGKRTRALALDKQAEFDEVFVKRGDRATWGRSTNAAGNPMVNFDLHAPPEVLAWIDPGDIPVSGSFLTEEDRNRAIDLSRRIVVDILRKWVRPMVAEFDNLLDKS